tara:strand:+ start:4726 stop:5364 length:639 start_codon:yes stop_codon:yes gene_type:complete
MSSLVSMMNALGGVARTSTAIMKTISQIGSGVQNIGQFFADAFNKAGKAIHDVYKQLSAWYDEYIKPKFDWLSDKASSIVNIFVDMGELVSSTWSSIIEKITNLYNTKIKPIFDFNLFSTMQGYFQSFRRDVESGLQEIEDKIKGSLIYKAGVGVKGVGGDAVDAIGDAGGEIKQTLGIDLKISGLAGDLADSISDAVEKEVKRVAGRLKFF